MLELLSPAGSMEAVYAAVQNGADAVYLGYGDFNARRNAKNFTKEEVASAVSYCHVRDTKVFLTLNTLLTDREMEGAARLAAEASGIGVDAVLVQDLGVARMLRQTVPDLPIHASTQMTIHSLDGVLRAAELGMSRVVLSRELGRDQIAYICQRSPIEIEVFAHGALCMCYSGQCFFSSVIGGRSGNRGLCAQPCRLNYGWGRKADEHPLSLKDMSLAGHIQELEEMGVTCLKIEGRMKRPEYVAVVTGVYARAIREGREPTGEELEALQAAFSREGFTDGYYLGEKGPHMFGTRQEQPFPKELFDRARASYENGENRKTPVTFYAMIRRGEKAQVAVEDSQGRVGRAEGAVPEEAVNVPLTAEKVEGQLRRTGGTPYECRKVRAGLDEGLSLPLAALNAMRRAALEDLTAQRKALPERRVGEYHAGVRYSQNRTPPVLTMSVARAAQVTPELLRCAPVLLYVPAQELAEHPEVLDMCREAGVEAAVSLPRICWDGEERQTLQEQLEKLRELGVTDALAGTLGVAAQAAQAGFRLRGDYGLGVYNSAALKELRHMGFRSATASFELKLAQIRDLNKAVDLELITYGRLPLMITENCIVSNHLGRCGCEEGQALTDRKGERFPVVKAFGCRNEILNGKILFLADKQGDYQRLGLWAQRLMFTLESPEECVKVARRYRGEERHTPRDITRGLYYRDVE